MAQVTLQVRILALDQGSKACGLAYHDGERFTIVDVLRPVESRPWPERMDYIAGELAKIARKMPSEIDVVAVEDVVLYIRSEFKAQQNVKSALTMGETRGYLFRVIRELFPRARLMDIHPSSTKAAVGAPTRREEAKVHTQRVIGAMLGRAVAEDAADACAMVLAVQARLQTEHLERMADRGAKIVASDP